MTPDNMQQSMQSLMSEAERRFHNPEFSEWIVSAMHTGLAQSADGWWDDGMASLKPWGFAVQSIRVPLQVWHGRLDRFVPFGHGEWLAANIPTAEAHLTDEDGHGSVVQRYVPQLHAWLLEHFE